MPTHASPLLATTLPHSPEAAAYGAPGCAGASASFPVVRKRGGMRGCEEMEVPA